MTQKKKCLTPTCSNESTPRTDFCQNCGANINMWGRRRPAERLQRKQRLALYTGRMSIVIERKK